MTTPEPMCAEHRWTYQAGCPDCQAHRRAVNARSRAQRLASGRISHGTRSGYDAGCRCTWCRAVRRAVYQREELYA